MMQLPGVEASFSRPRVSNDNAYAEAVFQTAKYRPMCPEKPFDTLEAAQERVMKFVTWHNEEHRHSSLKYVAPDERHRGVANASLANRTRLYLRARERHPERWSGGIRNRALNTVVYLNPERERCGANDVARVA